MISQKNKDLINHFLVGGLIFVIPSNLFLVIAEWGSYVRGLRVDYLLPKIFLSDLVIFALSFWLIFTRQVDFKRTAVLLKKKWTWLLTICLAWLIFNQFISAHPLAAVWHSFKIIEVIWVVYLLNQIWPKIKPKMLTISTSLTLIFQSSLAVLQFINQRSIANYWLLGEPNLNNPIGLAKQMFLGQNRILPYGTTAHPNVLGGFLVAMILFLLLNKERHKTKSFAKFLLFIAIIISLVTLWLTQSWSAFASLLLSIVIWKNKPNPKILISLTMTAAIASFLFLGIIGQTSKNPSLFRRYYLNQSAVEMVKNSPLVGLGINNFVGQVESFSPTREVVRFVQPAHHTFLLILSELGVIGVIFSLTLVSKILSKYWKFALLLTTTVLLPMLVLDHYLYTIQTGLLIFGLTTLVIKNSLTQPQK